MAERHDESMRNADRARPSVVHLIPGLRIGGTERGALQLAEMGIRKGQDHRLVLFDRPPGASEDEFPLRLVPATYLRRRQGVDLSFPIRLASRLYRWGATVVHTRNDTALFYGSIAVNLVKPRPTLVSTFGTYPSHATSAARFLTNCASRSAVMVAAVSNELRDRLVNERWVSHCRTIFNGVDTTLFSPDGNPFGLRQQLGLTSGEMLIGHLGRFDPIKRHSDLITAAKLLTITPRMPPFRLVIIGSGPMEESLRKEAADCSSITILPATHEVSAVLRELDLLVLCSAHEGAPRIILEAMATGTPIIATAVGGIPEILSETVGTCGYLVPVNQPKAIADAILEAVNCPMERQRRAALARKRVIAQFSAEREWLDYEIFYEKTRI